MEDEFNWSELSGYDLSYAFIIHGSIGDSQEYFIFGKYMSSGLCDYVLVFNSRNSPCIKITKKYTLTIKDIDILYSIYQWKKYEEFKTLSFKIEGQYIPNNLDRNLCFVE